MAERPETRFAWNGDICLAYQVLGSGEPDVLYLQGYASNVELNWEYPVVGRFLRRLAQGRRLIMADERGMGASERTAPDHVWPLESLVEDIVAVMDAVGCERIAIVATNEAANVACMFAATYPDRTAGLLLYEASANLLWSPETPWEWTEEQFGEQEAWLRLPWTREKAQEAARFENPSLADDPAYAEWWYRYRLMTEGWGHAISSARKYMHTDIRPILPSIHVPVVVLIRPGHPESSWVASGRHLASLIAGAVVDELPGEDSHLWAGDQAPVHRSVDAFLSDIRREQTELDRMLTTVLFIDVVGSTELLADRGDRGWRDLIERHRATVRSLLARFRGVEVDTAGDGVFATFEGPARAILCAKAISDESATLGLHVRAGVHTGEVEVADGKVAGLAVHIGARISQIAESSEVLVSQTVRDLVVGSGLHFEDRGEHALKGVPDRWRLFRAIDPPRRMP